MLIITIVVITIITSVVVMTFSDNNLIDSANEAVFKSNLSTYNETLAMFVLSEQLENYSTFNVNNLDYSVWTEDMSEEGTIKEAIPGIDDSYAKVLKVVNGELVYAGDNQTHLTWAKDIGIAAGSAVVDSDGTVTTAPNAPTYELSTTSWTSGNVTLTATYPTDAAVKQYKLGSSDAWAEYTAELSLESNTTVSLKSIDAAGNESSEVEIEVDNIDKTTPVSYNYSAETTINSVTVTAKTTDADSGLAGYKYKLTTEDDTVVEDYGSVTESTTKTFSGLTQNTTYKIYVVAVDNVGNSKEASNNGETVTTSSIASPTISYNTQATNESVEVTISSLSGYTTKYSVDSGATWVEGTTYTAATNMTIMAKYVAADNQESSVVTKTITNIDKTAPAAPSYTVTTTDWTNKDVTVTATFAEEGSSKQYKIGTDGSWTDYTQELTIENNNTIYLKETDSVGNSSSEVTVVIDNIDKVLPTAPSISGYTSGTYTNDDVELTFSSTDENSGISSYEYKIGESGTYETTASPITLTDEMSDTVYIRAKDTAGNYSEVSTIIVKIDSSLPTVTFGTNGNTTAAKSQSTTVTVADSSAGIDTSTLKYAWDTSNTVAPAFSTTFTSGATITKSDGTGTYYLWVTATDSAGNTVTTVSNAFEIDNTAPSDPTYEISPSDWTNGNVTVTATFAEEGSSKQYKLESDESWTTYTASIVLTSNDTVYFKETDSSGNYSAEVTAVVDKIDTVLPTVVFGTNGSSASQSVSTTVTVADSSAGIDSSTLKYAWDTSNTVAPTISTTFTSGATITKTDVTGTYYLWVTATDSAGNTITTKSNAFVIDNTAPTTPTYNVSTTNWTNANVTVTPTFSTDSVTKQYKLGSSGTWTTYNSAISVSSNNTVYFRSADSAGNYSSEATAVISNIDTTLPTVSLDVNTATATKSVTVTVTGSDTGGSSVSDIKYIWSTSSTALTTTDTSWSSASTITSGDTTTKSDVTDTYYLHTLVTDGAGNKTASVSGSYVIDNTAPTVTGVSATFNPTGFTNGNIEVTITGITADMSIIEYISPDVTEFTSLPSDNKITVTENGSIILNISDTAGNSSTKTIQITNIDKVAPTCAISTSDITDTSFTIAATAADAAATTTNANSGISKYEFYVNDSLVSTQTSTATTASYNVTGKTAETEYTCKVIVTDGASNTVTESTSVTTTATPQLLSIVNPGNYVTYDSGTDYTGDWIVLYDGTSEGNGNRVEIISAESTEDVSLGSYTASVAKTSYANVIDILNTYAAGYLNSTYTDRARSVGSDPSDPDSYGSISESLIYYGSTSSELWQTHHTTDTTALSNIGSLDIDEYYWLASRYLYSTSRSSVFNARYVSTSGSVTYDYLCYEDSSDNTNGYSYSRGFRPVVSIKSSIVITGGTGTQGDPYILGEPETQEEPIFEPGDYVEYDDGTDYTGDWIVLYDGSSSDNGNRIEIISAEITEYVELGYNDPTVPSTITDNLEKARYSYANMITTLNTYAEGYLNSTYADRARSVGSDPVTPSSYGSISESLVYYRYPIDTTEALSLNQTHHTTDTTALSNIGSLDIDEYYWLASRYLNSYSSSSYFHARYVNTSGSVAVSSLCREGSSGSTYGYSDSNGFRPVVSIKSSIVITGGTGTQGDPYILG